MTGSFSDYAENKVLDHITGKAEFTKPTVYVALIITSDATDASTGATITEPSTSGTAYARVATDADDWASASGGATSNAAAITFPTATGAGWGTVIGFALVDNGTVGQGNVLAWGELGADKTIAAGDTASFAIGDIDITLT